MTGDRITAAALISALAFSGTALAQSEAAPAPVEETEAPQMLEQEATPMDAPAAPAAESEETISEDDMADLLNSRQQLQQTYKLRRTINGEVVEIEERTVTFSRDDPYRATEAGGSPRERLLSAFDGEVLTRTEAYEEAKLDFTVADVDRNGVMTAEEFAALVDSRREQGDRQAPASDEEAARQRQYDAFLAEIDPEGAEFQSEAYAKEKFAFLSGAASQLTQQDYIRAYMRDFDSMDANNDRLLKNEELLRFRALNRGETMEM